MKRVVLLTIKQAAEMVDGLKPYRIRQLCISGKLEHIKAGNKYLINRTVLLDYIGEKDD